MENVMKMEDRVIELPGKPPCMLDKDLAGIYGVNTMRLNEARVNNPKKFTEGVDYFRLTVSDIENIDIDWKGGHLPYAYTKKGAFMFSTILNTDEAIDQAVAVVEGFCTFSLLMEEVKAGRVIMKPSPRQERPEWVFNNMRMELLDRSPLWRKICRYKDIGLNNREISLLIHLEKSTVRKHIRRMEVCGLLVPPKDLPKLQKCVEHFRGRLN